jgi:hypothetical protein
MSDDTHIDIQGCSHATIVATSRITHHYNDHPGTPPNPEVKP